jgi:hypothetical protein
VREAVLSIVMMWVSEGWEEGECVDKAGRGEMGLEYLFLQVRTNLLQLGAERGHTRLLLNLSILDNFSEIKAYQI